LEVFEKEEVRDEKEVEDREWRRGKVMRVWRSRSWSWVFWIEKKAWRMRAS
jgi:hypothetical protein